MIYIHGKLYLYYTDIYYYVNICYNLYNIEIFDIKNVPFNILYLTFNLISII